MLQWLFQNLGTVIAYLIFLAVVGLIIRYLVRQKKQGKSSCGNNCAHCAMHGSCHSHQESGAGK